MESYTTLNSNLKFDFIITEQEKKNIADEIIMCKKIKINYINHDKLVMFLGLTNIIINEITPFATFKYNVIELINQLKTYYTDIIFTIEINSPCVNECKILQPQYTYNYDIYLKMEKNNKKFDYGFDFFFDINEDSNNRNKYTESKILLDSYEYYIEEDIKTHVDIKNYLYDISFKLLTTISTLEDNEYMLAENIFVKSCGENKTNKQILKELGYFSKIIEWKKSNLIDVEELFDELRLKDDKTEEQIDKKIFLKIINDICCKNQISFSTKQKNINYDIFEILLLNISSNYNSPSLLQYKNVYLKAIKMLMESLKIIINMVNEINMKKTFTPEYINSLIMFHLDEFRDPNVIDNFIKKKITT